MFTSFTKNTYLFLFAISVLVLSLSSCQKEDVVEPTDPILGTWNLDRVVAAATIAGIPLMETDENPTGTIRFESSGIGFTDYSFTMFNESYPSNTPFGWTKENDIVMINDGNNVTQTWTILEQTASTLVATWNEFLIDGTTEAMFTFEMSK